MEKLKKEVLEILEPRFGMEIIEFIEKYYEPDHKTELVDMAFDLLVSKVGRENAEKLMKSILKKHPL